MKKLFWILSIERTREMEKVNKAEDMKIILTADELLIILSLYDEDRFEAENLNARTFVDKIFNQYHRERLNPEDAKEYAGVLPDCLRWCDPTISVCDSPNTANK